MGHGSRTKECGMCLEQLNCTIWGEIPETPLCFWNVFIRVFLDNILFMLYIHFTELIKTSI